MAERLELLASARNPTRWGMAEMADEWWSDGCRPGEERWGFSHFPVVDVCLLPRTHFLLVAFSLSVPPSLHLVSLLASWNGRCFRSIQWECYVVKLLLRKRSRLFVPFQ